ncbi:MAG: PKD domain-containing protein [Caldilineales bacterium]|nr:PKD domain-containing protein [Caldilineales bacterium]
MTLKSKSNFPQRIVARRTIAVALALLVILSMVVPASAFDPGGVDANLSPNTLDDGYLDVGAEHSADAPPLGPGGADLPLCRTSARNFYYRMRGAGYTGSNSFLYEDSLAWERDFKRAALGGTEEYYVDNVDIWYYCDHGNSGSVWFPWLHNDANLVPNDCYGSWGTKDAEWGAFGTCLTLTDRGGWANCMNGLHLLAGYITVSYDADEGGTWANQLLSGKSVTQSWFTMCDITQPSSVIARVIAEDYRHFNDRVHGRGGPAYGDVVDNTYYWIDHRCNKPVPLAVDPDAILAMPIYEVQQRTVDEDYVQSLATALGVEGDVTLEDGVFTLTDTSSGMTETLQISEASGGYVFQNNAALWSPPPPGEPSALPDENEAAQAAEAYFLANGQSLPGTQYRSDQEAVTEQATEVTKAAPGLLAQIMPERIVQTVGVDVMVSYGRRLDVLTAAGNVQEVSVAGPGASTKYYVGQSVGALAVSADEPIGLQGGSRDVALTAKSVDVQTADKAWDAFIDDPQLAVVTIPLDATRLERDPSKDTMAYYEQPHGVSQAELIPVWVFTVDFYNGDELITEDALVYVPVSPDYYPPTVDITSPENDSEVVPGEMLTFSADVSGGYEPFTYEWSSSRDGVLGTNETVHAALSFSLRSEQSEPTAHTITLKVTNANGQVRTDSIVVMVSVPPVYMPLMTAH